MADTKIPREFDTREKQQRQWKPAEMLPSPNPEPGYAFRWVRIAMHGKDDPTNVSGKLREGWEPVKAQDHPELQLHTISDGRFAGGVEVGGLLLMKTPQYMVDQRNAYYNNQSAKQMETVDNSLMKENDPRMPLFRQRESKVSFGKG